MGGVEPTTFRSESDNTNHCATEATHVKLSEQACGLSRAGYQPKLSFTANPAGEENLGIQHQEWSHILRKSKCLNLTLALTLA